MDHGYLHVVVKYAKDLIAADYNLTTTPSSDPYCVIQLGDQSHRTVTVPQNLNPVWKQAFSFKIGGRRSWADRLVSCSWRDPKPSAGAEEFVELSVFDEDVWKADDFLGSNRICLEPIMQSPCIWHAGEVELYLDDDDGSPTLSLAPTGQPQGSVKLLMLFEPRSRASPYFMRILSAVMFWNAFALYLIAASAQWQPVQGPLNWSRQEGVSQTLGIASALSFGTGLLHFAFAHLPQAFEAEALLRDHDGSSGLSNAMKAGAGSGSDGKVGNDLLKVLLRTVSLRQTEIAISSYLDVRLALLMLGKLFVVLPMLLGLLALFIQWLGGSLALKAGELLDVAATACMLMGIACIVKTNHDDNQQKGSMLAPCKNSSSADFSPIVGTPLTTRPLQGSSPMTRRATRPSSGRGTPRHEGRVASLLGFFASLSSTCRKRAEKRRKTVDFREAAGVREALLPTDHKEEAEEGAQPTLPHNFSGSGSTLRGSPTPGLPSIMENRQPMLPLGGRGEVAARSSNVTRFGNSGSDVMRPQFSNGSRRQGRSPTHPLLAERKSLAPAVGAGDVARSSGSKPRTESKDSAAS